MAPNTCILCEGTPSLSCASYHSAQYCGKKCQKFDYPLHKILCKKVRPFLHTGPSPNHKLGILFSNDACKGFGYASSEWQSDIGSVLVASADDKGISPQQVWALAYFYPYLLQDHFEEADEKRYVLYDMELKQKWLNRASFDKLLGKYQEEVKQEDKFYS